MISVTEQSNGLVYRAPALNNNNTRVPNFAYRAAVAYVTGSHSFKTGFNRTHGYQETTNYNLNPLAFQFNGGVPNQLTMRANPVTSRNHLDNDLGIFAQDKWTLKRTTVNLALRYDHFASSFPEQMVGPAHAGADAEFRVPGPGQPELERHHLPDRADLRPARQRQDGGQGDVQQVPARADPEPAWQRSEPGQHDGHHGEPHLERCSTATSCPTATCSTSRPNGECLGINNPLFGSAARSATFDDILRRGYGNRETNWEFSAGVQHEVLPRVSVDVGYFRRIWKNFRVTDDLSVAATDYQTFSMIVPTDPRLPGGGGNTLEGLVALNRRPSGVRPRTTTRWTAPTAARRSTGTASTSPSTRGSRTGCRCRSAPAPARRWRTTATSCRRCRRC